MSPHSGRRHQKQRKYRLLDTHSPSPRGEGWDEDEPYNQLHLLARGRLRVLRVALAVLFTAITWSNAQVITDQVAQPASQVATNRSTRQNLRLPEIALHDPWILADKPSRTYYLYTSNNHRS